MMDLDQWVYQEEERIDQLFASGEIDMSEQSKMLKELYREARGYEQDDRERYYEQYPGMGQW